MLPIVTNTVIQTLNLSSDERIISIFEQHAKRVVLGLKRISNEEVWSDLQADLADEDILDSYQYAYCYYMLSATCEFLNLKTIGEGIIKTTGFDQQSTELLSGHEIQIFKKNLEIQALELISEYLSQEGYDRLRELKFGTSKLKRTRIKATVI